MEFTAEQIANGKTWIAALRSGDYRQGVFALRKQTSEGFSYCCLGVAQEIFSITPLSTQGGDFLNLSEAEEQLGLSNLAQKDFAGMNDAGCSFPYIADRIESFYGLTEQAA